MIDKNSWDLFCNENKEKWREDAMNDLKNIPVGEYIAIIEDADIVAIPADNNLSEEKKKIKFNLNFGTYGKVSRWLSLEPKFLWIAKKELEILNGSPIDDISQLPFLIDSLKNIKISLKVVLNANGNAKYINFISLK